MLEDLGQEQHPYTYCYFNVDKMMTVTAGNIRAEKNEDDEMSNEDEFLDAQQELDGNGLELENMEVVEKDMKEKMAAATKLMNADAMNTSHDDAYRWHHNALLIKSDQGIRKGVFQCE